MKLVKFEGKLISTSSNEIKVMLLLLHLNQFVTSTSNQMGARKKHRSNTKKSTMRIFDGFHALVCCQVPYLTILHTLPFFFSEMYHDCLVV